MAKRSGGGPTATSPGSGRMTKAERREAARRERAELLRKQARKRKQRRWFTIVGAVVAAGAIAAVALLSTGGGSSSHKLTGLLTTEAPWPANATNQDALTRADAIGLPAGGGNYHIHALLQVYVNGVTQTVPAGIGFCGSGTSATPCAAIHTHDSTGIMHMEAASRFPFTLGDFLDVWGVKFTPRCIGAYCDGLGGTLRVYLNGQPYTGDPTQLPITAHDDVVVTYGKASQLPKPIPSTYSKSISTTCAPDC